MSDEKPDYHERMILAFQQYFIYHDRFESDNNIAAAIKARHFLYEIKNAATEGRAEILKKKRELKKSRKGIPGRPKRIIKGK